MTEYTGCVYENPRETTATVNWHFDEKSGQKIPLDLTKSQLSGMKLLNLPVRIEHQNRVEHKNIYGNEVGRVTGVTTHPTTGKTDVTYLLHDNPAGFTAKTLIEQGTIRDLSLNHTYHPDSGRVEPVEISLCVKGARSGTHIYKRHPKAGDKSQNLPGHQQTHTIMASGSSAAPALSSGGGSEQAPQILTGGEGKDLAPKKETGGGGVPAAASDQAATPAPRSDLEFLEALSGTLGDSDVSKELFERFGKLMKGRLDVNDTNKHLVTKLKALEDSHKRITDNNEKTAEQMIAVMNDLFHRFAPQSVMSESTAKEVTKTLGQNPALLDAFRGVPIMASAISFASNNNAAAATTTNADRSRLSKELDQSKAAVAHYEAQLFAMGNASVNEAQLWEKPVSHPVQVAASADTWPGEGVPSAKRQGLVPSWLKDQCGRYEEEGFQQNKIFGNDFH